MNRFATRNVVSVSCVCMFVWFSLSCDRRKEHGARHADTIQLNEMNAQILRLFEEGTLRPLGAYRDSHDVLVRLIEVGQREVIEICVSFDGSGALNVIRRMAHFADKNFETSSRSISLSESKKLTNLLEKLRLNGPEIALRASPPAIDTGDYLIEVYSVEGNRAFYRSGFSPNYPGDLGDLRDLIFQLAQPIN